MIYPASFRRPFDPIGLAADGWPDADTYWQARSINRGNGICRSYAGWMPGPINLQITKDRVFGGTTVTATYTLTGAFQADTGLTDGPRLASDYASSADFHPVPNGDANNPAQFILIGSYTDWFDATTPHNGEWFATTYPSIWPFIHLSSNYAVAGSQAVFTGSLAYDQLHSRWAVYTGGIIQSNGFFQPQFTDLPAGMICTGSVIQQW